MVTRDCDDENRNPKRFVQRKQQGFSGDFGICGKRRVIGDKPERNDRKDQSGGEPVKCLCRSGICWGGHAQMS
tara:strand:- start:122 stop:340 length:219 start_codon:yes stop_codon:yes gene_type:complete